MRDIGLKISWSFNYHIIRNWRITKNSVRIHKSYIKIITAQFLNSSWVHQNCYCVNWHVITHYFSNLRFVSRKLCDKWHNSWNKHFIKLLMFLFTFLLLSPTLFFFQLIWHNKDTLFFKILRFRNKRSCLYYTIPKNYVKIKCTMQWNVIQCVSNYRKSILSHDSTVYYVNKRSYNKSTNMIDLFINDFSQHWILRVSFYYAFHEWKKIEIAKATFTHDPFNV